MEPYERYEHAGVIVEIMPDDEPLNDPQQHDNAGTIYSWTSGWDGDEYISEPEVGLSQRDQAELFKLEAALKREGGVELAEEIDELRSRESLGAYMARNYDAAVTIPLRFSDYGSSGARIYEDDSDPNCALCFTQEEIEEEWSGNLAGAAAYATARVNELDLWMQGYVFGIVIRERNPAIEPGDDDQGEVLESVWGFIGEPDASWIRSEADAMAEACAEQVEHERQEVANWAARDVVTV